MGKFDVLTAELGCDAHAVTSSCHLLCGTTDTIVDVNLPSIDCTSIWAKRPGITNTLETVGTDSLMEDDVRDLRGK